MKKNSVYFVLTFGLFLGWLLSFLYNGPALQIMFNSNFIDIKILAIFYILTPALVSFYIGFFNLKDSLKSKLLMYSSVYCLIGTALTFVFTYFKVALPIYLLSATMGICSVFFIAGWGCYFVKILNNKTMYKYMAYSIVVGYAIFNINRVFAKLNINSLVLCSLFVCLITVIYFANKVIKIETPSTVKQDTKLEIDVLVMLCFIMFLLNIGGGIIQSAINPFIDSNFTYNSLIDLFTYLLIGMAVYKTKKMPSYFITIIISIVTISCGFLFLLLLPSTCLIAYALIVIGYAILDIFIWALVGEVGYLYDKPLKVFLFVMSSNLLAVFMGNLIGSYFSLSSLIIPVLIATIGSILAFAFIPFLQNIINKRQEEIRLLKVNEDIGNVYLRDIKDKLTAKEYDIFLLMLDGIKNKEIATNVNISYNTFKGHARNIYKKLSVSNKKELLDKVNKGVL